MLKLQNVSKHFNGLTILDNISLTIEKGSIVGLMGPSGCGKSTLLRCIQGFESYDKGSILCQEKVCLILQDFQLFPHMNVLDNITYGMKHVLKIPKKEAEIEALSLLKELGLEDKAYVMPHTLSGGQKQRVAILRAMASKADLLLLDEPTSALDAQSIGEVVQLIKKLNAMGLTLLVVSHDESFLKMITTTIYGLKQGALIEQN